MPIFGRRKDTQATPPPAARPVSAGLGGLEPALAMASTPASALLHGTPTPQPEPTPLASGRRPSTAGRRSGRPVRRNRGQKTTIANEIRRNLDNYTDSQICDELLQNADDAGADRCAFLIDHRQHGVRTLYGGRGSAEGGRMAELQGPALVMFDSAVFREEDFDGLFAFGKGSKKFDPTRTGKFGLGFNSVYHTTEAPMFVSGEFFVRRWAPRPAVAAKTPCYL